MTVGPGHKNGPPPVSEGYRSRIVLDTDPGLDHDFVDTGPVAISTRAKAEDRERFYAAVRSQGPEQVDHPEGEGRVLKVRRRAIDMARERARKDSRISDAAFRFFDAVASRCKWKNRYCHQSMDMLSFSAGKNPRHSNGARYVDGLVELGYLVDIHIPNAAGGRHKRYLTVVCTAADRTGQTLSDIATEAMQLKVRGSEEGQDEISANDRTSNQSWDVNGRAIRNPDALSCTSGEPTRNPDVSTRQGYVSIRSPDALTLDTHFTKAKGEGGGARPHRESQGVHGPPSGGRRTRPSARAPRSPPAAECDMQQSDGRAAGATGGSGLSPEVYAIHRSWWPRRTGEDADNLLIAHLQTLNGDKAPARL
jgi:hypothetical protein